MDLEAYLLGRKLLIRLQSETFNGTTELRVGLTVDAKKNIEAAIKKLFYGNDHVTTKSIQTRGQN